MTRRSGIQWATLLPLVLVGASFLGCNDNAQRRAIETIVQFDVLEPEYTLVRRYSSFVAGGGINYLECLRCAGNNADFDLELLELEGKRRADIIDSATLARFDGLQSQMDTGGGRRILFQRDFRVADVDLFARNYRSCEAH